MEQTGYNLLTSVFKLGISDLGVKLPDVEFFLDYYEKYGGPVLDIGCGAGRVLLRMAQKGIEIDGVDYSEQLLATLNNRLKSENENIQKCVKIFRQDMRELSLNRKYKMILMPDRTIMHLTSIEDQIRSLEKVKEHLYTEGIFIFNVIRPNNIEELLNDDNDESFVFEYQDENNPEIIHKLYNQQIESSKINMSYKCKTILRTYKNTELLNEDIGIHDFNFYTWSHLQLLFKIVGFEIVAEYGDFDKQKLDDNSKWMIFVVKKKI